VDGVVAAPELIEHKWQLFLELMRWVESGSCRHDAILRYFGDEEETLAGCGRCDVCEQVETTQAHDPEQVTLIVRKALSGIARVHGRFGLMLAAKLLAGERDPRLQRTGLDSVRTFGVLSDWPVARLVRLLRRCVSAGWVSFSGDDRPVVMLTESGGAVMRGERAARLLLPPSEPPARAGPGRSRAFGPGARPERALVRELDETAERLFQALRAHRLVVARSEGVAPFIIASDRSLRDLSVLRPRDERELLAVHGIGPAKAARYGAGLLQVVNDVASQA
jgi:ATP-dependent DNA helicase RecQ